MQNNKRYWLRGGIISIIIFTPLYILSLYSGGHPGATILFFLPIAIAYGVLFKDDIFHFVDDIAKLLGGSLLDYNLAGYLFLLPFYLVIGIFLGWLYGKIKNRNRV